MKVISKQQAQAIEYIMTKKSEFNSLIEFRDDIQKLIDDLAGLPENSSSEIKFLIRVRNELGEMITTPNVLRVPINTWYSERYNDDWNYWPFCNDTKEIPRPNETKYEVGDVVVVNMDDDVHVGVVLGVIDNVRQDLRTDVCGMVCFDNIRHATMEDVKSAKNASNLLKYLED